MRRRTTVQATWPAWWEFPALGHWLTAEEIAADDSAEGTCFLLLLHAVDIYYQGNRPDPPPGRVATTEHRPGSTPPPRDLVDAARAEHDSRTYLHKIGPRYATTTRSKR